MCVLETRTRKITKEQNDTYYAAAMRTILQLVLFLLRLKFSVFVFSKDHPIPTTLCGELKHFGHHLWEPEICTTYKLHENNVCRPYLKFTELVLFLIENRMSVKSV